MKRLILSIVLSMAAVLAFGQSKAKTKDTSRNIPTTTNTAFRVKFNDVFKRNTDGSYSTLYPVQINGDNWFRSVVSGRYTLWWGRCGGLRRT
ncbi:hypothetical protein [Mucilaginibacter sp. BT774]|uniref:hypothetical protein n=1 Tax=Mucilaginibacter sp. BT774 TaxID=3062276 RepID=UPI002674B2B4|nr:hypothetical protein [Mucilaginibacter sp. BT774]MDO3625229.1 hypothetical protein [Mucilaginibacter sp. BT774]